MSKYTTEVRYICEQESGLKGSVGYNSIDKVIKDAIPGVFSFDFPIFDENYREVICTKILRHYYTREIGFETVGLWKLKLQTKLCEIMPYYNQLYNSELIKFNPLYDTDLNTTHVGEKDSLLDKEENKTGLSNDSREVNQTGSVNKTNNNIENSNVDGKTDNIGTREDSETNNVDKSSNNIESRNRSTSKQESNIFNESDSGDKSSNRNIADESTNAKSNKHYDLYSDTPQGALNGVEDEEYLTNARKITDGSTDVTLDNKAESANEKYGNTKVGNGSTTGTENENDGRNSMNVESENAEKSKTENSYDSGAYSENGAKTSIGSEDTKNNSNITDVGNKNSLENTKGLDKFNSTESYVLHVVGKQSGASYSKLLKEFRDTFLNIDMDVINSLSDLFMNLW